MTWPDPWLPYSRSTSGMTLLELLIALALCGLLLLGLVQIASASSASTRLQRNQAQMQESARLAMSRISRFAREAGYNPEPWKNGRFVEGLSEESADSVMNGSDRLALRSWSNLNCFDNRNETLDPFGQPAFFIRETVFDLNSSRGLTWECRYGPSPSELVTQVRRQGLVESVESFQVLFAEDRNRDRIIDRWVKAGQWTAQGRVLGIRVALLLVSEDRLTGRTHGRFEVLDEYEDAPADGRLRQVFRFAAAFRGRTG